MFLVPFRGENAAGNKTRFLFFVNPLDDYLEKDETKERREEGTDRNLRVCYNKRRWLE